MDALREALFLRLYHHTSAVGALQLPYQGPAQSPNTSTGSILHVQERIRQRVSDRGEPPFGARESDLRVRHKNDRVEAVCWSKSPFRLQLSSRLDSKWDNGIDVEGKYR